MGILRKTVDKLTRIGTKTGRKTARTSQTVADAAADKAAEARPSPNPATNLLIADLALRGGGQLLRHAVERGLLGKAYTPEKAKKLVKGRTMGQTLVGTAIARIATRSIPGALIVRDGMLAKTLYDRKRGKEASEEGRKTIEQQARRGSP